MNRQSIAFELFPEFGDTLLDRQNRDGRPCCASQRSDHCAEPPAFQTFYQPVDMIAQSGMKQFTRNLIANVNDIRSPVKDHDRAQHAQAEIRRQNRIRFADLADLLVFRDLCRRQQQFVGSRFIPLAQTQKRGCRFFGGIRRSQQHEFRTKGGLDIFGNPLEPYADCFSEINAGLRQIIGLVDVVLRPYEIGRLTDRFEREVIVFLN